MTRVRLTASHSLITSVAGSPVGWRTFGAARRGLCQAPLAIGTQAAKGKIGDLQAKLDRVQLRPAALRPVVQIQPFATPFQAKPETHPEGTGHGIGGENQVALGLELCSCREHEAARLGRIVRQTHPREVDDPAAAVEQFDDVGITLRSAANLRVERQDLVDAQEQGRGIDAPRLGLCRLRLGGPETCRVLSENRDDVISIRQVRQFDRLVQRSRLAPGALVDAIAVGDQAGAGHLQQCGVLARDARRLTGERRAGRNQRTSVAALQPAAKRG